MSSAIVPCRRCGDPCKTSPAGDPKARPFRKAKRGNCAACAVCIFFQSDDPDEGLGFALPPDFDPEGLRLPHLQKQFARVLIVGGSELTMEQIDWDKVISKWTLARGAKA